MATSTSPQNEQVKREQAQHTRQIVRLFRPNGTFWRLSRFAMIILGMSLLLFWQASDFDATEIYSIAELGVVLLAFELGAIFGRGRNELLDFVRFLVVITGMATLLFFNAQTFDETEMWVLIGLPMIIAVFEGARSWLTQKIQPTLTMPTPVDLTKGLEKLAHFGESALGFFSKLGPKTQALVIVLVGSIVGPLVGVTSGELLRNIPQEIKASPENNGGLLERLASEPDPKVRQKLLGQLAEMTAQIPEVKILGLTNSHQGKDVD